MVGYITLFLWSVALFVVLVAVVYPRLMLRMKCSVKASLDRGIERIKGDGFLGIVYLPHASIRDKIDRYVIEEKNGVKYLRLNFTEKVRYIDYDVIVFGGIFNESFMLRETFFGTAVIIGGLSFFSVLAFGLLARRKKKK